MNFLKSLVESLSGKKTYLFIILLFVMFILDIKGFIPPEMQPYKEEIYAVLAAGAGISLRLAVNKTK